MRKKIHAPLRALPTFRVEHPVCNVAQFATPIYKMFNAKTDFACWIEEKILKNIESAPAQHEPITEFYLQLYFLLSHLKV